MKETFVIENEDKGLSIILKREANIILASLDENSEEFLCKKNRFRDILIVLNSIENLNPQNDNEICFILDIINRIWNTGILSPLTLKEDEFLDYKDEKGNRRNIRYSDIYINKNNNIYNENAFNIVIRTAYNHNDNKQIEFKPHVLHKNHRVYISKGGIITGEYIEDCMIRNDVVEKHVFTIQSIVNIPVSIIYDKDFYIYVVDHREPKIKALKQFYYVPENYDASIADKHYNIRKYIKL